MLSASAPSVPGRIEIHWSERAAVDVYRGSMFTILAPPPFGLDFITPSDVIVPSLASRTNRISGTSVSARLLPHRIIMREFRKSDKSWPSKLPRISLAPHGLAESPSLSPSKSPALAPITLANLYPAPITPFNAEMLPVYGAM